VDKMFIENACVILRDKVGAKDSAAEKGEPKWDSKKLEVNDVFSNVTYL